MYKDLKALFHEIGSWRVTSFPKGLARVIETDSLRSRTLVVSTFPTPLSQTERAPFNALGFPGSFPSLMADNRMSFGQMHYAHLPHLCHKPCLASPCKWLSHSLITTQALSPCRSRGVGDPMFRHHNTS